MMKNPVIAKSLASIRKNPWGAVIAVGSWILIETTEHRLFGWLNSKIDEDSGPIILVLRLSLAWMMGHPVELGLSIAAAYCVFIITNAQFAVNRERQQSVPSGKLGELGFVYPGEPLGQRWTPNVQGAARPLFSPLLNAPIPHSVAISGQWDPGIDRNVEPYTGLCKRLTYTAQLPGHAAVYTYVSVLGPDGSKREKWLQHVLGREDEPIGDMDMQDERKIYVLGKSLKDGWLFFDLFLPDEVRRAYAREGLVYSALLKVRLRGSLSISPIELYGE